MKGGYGMHALTRTEERNPVFSSRSGPTETAHEAVKVAPGWRREMSCRPSLFPGFGLSVLVSARMCAGRGAESE